MKVGMYKQSYVHRDREYHTCEWNLQEHASKLSDNSYLLLFCMLHENKHYYKPTYNMHKFPIQEICHMS